MARVRAWVIVLLSAALCISSGVTYARDTTDTAVTGRRFSVELRPTWNMPSNGFYNGHNSTGKVIACCSSFHLKYGFTLSPESRDGKLYPGAYQGIGLGAYTFFSHYETGTPLALYLFQGSRLFDLSPSLSLDYEWNLGLSAGWRRNEVVGSSLNILINVGLPLTWSPSKDWEFHLTPDYTHFSNGDTTFPNGGANTFGCRIGITRNFGNNEIKAAGSALIGTEEDLKELDFFERLSYDMTFYGGWRADRIIHGYSLVILNRHFALGGMTFNPLYKLNRYFSVGPSIDAMFDRSADIIPICSEDDSELLGYTLPEAWRQTSLGISARGEVKMPIYSINIGVGYNFAGFSSDLKGLYTTYNLKTFISDRIFLNIGYRLSSNQYTHNLMLGFGMKI